MDEFEKCINASDLIDWIIETCPDWCEGTIRTIVDHIDEMPPAQPKPQWISCSEKLPVEYERAITLYDNGKISGGEYIGNRTWNVDYGDSDKKVKIVAWMPLPEPYAERKIDE